MIRIIKKDGTREDYNVQKVVAAVTKSANRALVTFTDEDYTGGFEDLHKYRVFEFGQENPYIYVSLADEKLTYQIFSVWVCDANADTDCIQADPDDAAFQQILDKAVAGCAFDYGVDVTTDDHILTLSTCTADPNSRLLVVAKLIDGGGVNVAS